MVKPGWVDWTYFFAMVRLGFLMPDFLPNRLITSRLTLARNMGRLITISISSSGVISSIISGVRLYWKLKPRLVN